METSNLIAYQLRKLATEGGDVQKLEETLRRLLANERQAHAEPRVEPALLKLVSQ